ncbi:hypothetical protein DFH06DRAFT_1478454 [Mycena polygramma]|nr:hypothetical protein DFH06DRAFT_1478454 [Mycena polygramma]
MPKQDIDTLQNCSGLVIDGSNPDGSSTCSTTGLSRFPPSGVPHRPTPLLTALLPTTSASTADRPPRSTTSARRAAAASPRPRYVPLPLSRLMLYPCAVRAWDFPLFSYVRKRTHPRARPIPSLPPSLCLPSPSASDPQRFYHRRRRRPSRAMTAARRLLKHKQLPVQKRLNGERGGIQDESCRLRLPRSARTAVASRRDANSARPAHRNPSTDETRGARQPTLTQSTLCARCPQTRGRGALAAVARKHELRESFRLACCSAAPLRFYPPPTRSPQLTRQLARPSLPSLPLSFLTLTDPQPIRIRRADAQARLERLKIQRADSSSSITNCG